MINGIEEIKLTSDNNINETNELYILASKAVINRTWEYVLANSVIISGNKK